MKENPYFKIDEPLSKLGAVMSLFDDALWEETDVVQQGIYVMLQRYLSEIVTLFESANRETERLFAAGERRHKRARKAVA